MHEICTTSFSQVHYLVCTMSASCEMHINTQTLPCRTFQMHMKCRTTWAGTVSAARLNRPDIFTYTRTFWIFAPDMWQARCIKFCALQLCGMAPKEVCYSWQKRRQLCMLHQKHSKEVSRVCANSAAIQTPNIYRTHKRRALAWHGTWLKLFCPSCCMFSTYVAGFAHFCSICCGISSKLTSEWQALY